MSTACPATASYHHVQRMIRKLAHNHAKHWHQDPDDVMGEAHIAFCHAWNTWDPSRGKFTTWAWHNVALHLRRWQGRASKEAVKGFQFTNCEFDHYTNRRQFSVDTLLHDLSGEARRLVEAALAVGEQRNARERFLAKITLTCRSRKHAAIRRRALREIREALGCQG